MNVTYCRIGWLIASFFVVVIVHLGVLVLLITHQQIGAFARTYLLSRFLLALLDVHEAACELRVLELKINFVVSSPTAIHSIDLRGILDNILYRNSGFEQLEVESIDQCTNLAMTLQYVFYSDRRSLTSQKRSLNHWSG